MGSPDALVDALDRCLPQTQCGECDFPGCRPYADAMARGEATIDRCAPGGERTLNALANVLAASPEPHRTTVAQRYQPPSSVWIDPDVCIGCTKCLQVCPTDAIVGAAKRMHAVIQSECTGCDLCLPVCPVDCMHSTNDPDPPTTHAAQQAQADYFRWRYERMTSRRRSYQRQRERLHQQQRRQVDISSVLAEARARLQPPKDPS